MPCPKCHSGPTLWLKNTDMFDEVKKPKCLEMNRHEKERENGKLQGKNIRDIYDSQRRQCIINFKNKKQSS